MAKRWIDIGRYVVDFNEIEAFTLVNQRENEFSYLFVGKSGHTYESQKFSSREQVRSWLDTIFQTNNKRPDFF